MNKLYYDLTNNGLDLVAENDTKKIEWFETDPCDAWRVVDEIELRDVSLADETLLSYFPEDIREIIKKIMIYHFSTNEWKAMAIGNIALEDVRKAFNLQYKDVKIRFTENNTDFKVTDNNYATPKYLTPFAV